MRIVYLYIIDILHLTLTIGTTGLLTNGFLLDHYHDITHNDTKRHPIMQATNNTNYGP